MHRRAKGTIMKKGRYIYQKREVQLSKKGYI